jgi:glycerol-3-phosphate dehydrogenase
MNREQTLQSLLARKHAPFDLAVIGGGATGVGIALDAASRGYSTLLLEQSDFGKGTSSRSTKLIHGGVRYLQQGNLSLVMEALKERGILRQNAPHLVHDLAFVVPNYAWWEAPFYGVGMKVYDALAGRYNFGKSRHLTKAQLLARIPNLETKGLRGGVLYYDGQFDDARLLIDLAQTASQHGALLLNYAPVTALSKDRKGFATGLTFTDIETGRSHAIAAKAIINATGPFADVVRNLDDASSPPMIAPSQGVHLVLDGSFLSTTGATPTAIMVPRTSDGRVMFAIPWHGRTLLGTTDTPIPAAALEPEPLDEEIDFLLDTAERYLSRKPARADVKSVFTGIRPLVKASPQAGGDTAALSRDHTITISKSGLLTIAGGKWTTYRKMAEDAVDHAATLARLDDRPCVTRTLPIHGHDAPPPDDATGLPVTATTVARAARHEMARTVDDVLARRTRALFLDARAAIEAAPEVARLLAAELGRDDGWQADQVRQFVKIAQNYLIAPSTRDRRRK